MLAKLEVALFSRGRNEKMERTGILVVDDHPIVCEALAALINRQDNLYCSGTAGTLAEAEAEISKQKPALVLLDLRLQGADGMETVQTLRTLFPSVRVLVISQFDEAVYAEPALRAGASGFLMKEQATDEVLRAIRTVLSGQIYVSSKVRLQAVQRMLETKHKGQTAARVTELGTLTDRQLQVFRAVGAGKRNREIAAELGLSVKTIETYRELIKYKLKISSGAELVARARAAAHADSGKRTQLHR